MNFGRPKSRLVVSNLAIIGSGRSELTAARFCRWLRKFLHVRGLLHFGDSQCRELLEGLNFRDTTRSLCRFTSVSYDTPCKEPSCICEVLVRFVSVINQGAELSVSRPCDGIAAVHRVEAAE